MKTASYPELIVDDYVEYSPESGITEIGLIGPELSEFKGGVRSFGYELKVEERTKVGDEGVVFIRLYWRELGLSGLYSKRRYIGSRIRFPLENILGELLHTLETLCRQKSPTQEIHLYEENPTKGLMISQHVTDYLHGIWATSDQLTRNKLTHRKWLNLEKIIG